MANSTRQKLEGAIHEAKGAAKQKAGEITNDKQLEAEGETEKVAGIVQKKLGQIQEVFEK